MYENAVVSCPSFKQKEKVALYNKSKDNANIVTFKTISPSHNPIYLNILLVK